MKRSRSKTLRSAKQKLIDQKCSGDEPILNANSSDLDIIKYYNWFNYMYNADDAKSFALDWFKASLKKNKTSPNIAKGFIKTFSLIDAKHVRTIGWNCRSLSRGGSLPKKLDDAMWSRINKLMEEAKTIKTEDVVVEPAKEVISIQERVEARAGDLIGMLEEQVDKFVLEGKNDFDVAVWFRQQAIKPMIAKKIAEYYQPLYSELFDAVSGKDEDLKYAYRKWKKPALKKYCEFVKSIVSVCETNSIVSKAPRKPRAKKVKPAAELVAKMKYKEKDDGGNISSISPTSIVGANQLWTYNTANRSLTVYTAISPAGLSVKGTTITGFDEKTSITKVLRKPELVLKTVLDAGKVSLRKIMDDLTTKPKNASGRINTDTLLLRVVK